MKALKVVLISLFVFGFVVGNAHAQISIGLPRYVSAEKLAKIFQEESKDIFGLDIKTLVHQAYKPGSVQQVPESIMILINETHKKFFFFGSEVSKGRLHGVRLAIKLLSGKQYIEVQLYDRDYTGLNTTTWYFQDIKPAFEKLLKRVYARLQEK